MTGKRSFTGAAAVPHQPREERYEAAAHLRLTADRYVRGTATFAEVEEALEILRASHTAARGALELTEDSRNGWMARAERAEAEVERLRNGGCANAADGGCSACRCCALCAAQAEVFAERDNRMVEQVRAEQAESQLAALREALEQETGAGCFDHAQTLTWCEHCIHRENVTTRTAAVLADTATAATERDARLRAEGLNSPS